MKKANEVIADLSGIDIEPLLKSAQVAKLLNVSEVFLQLNRSDKTIALGMNIIPFVKLGGLIRYEPAAIRQAILTASALSTLPRKQPKQRPEPGPGEPPLPPLGRPKKKL